MTVELKKRYNVHDVARGAGVSAMTVTRVFDASAPVAPETRKKVMAVATKLNYRPSRTARTLRQGRSQSIGMLWSLSGPHDSAGVVRQMTRLMSEAGYVTYLTDTMSDYVLIKNCLTDLIERKVDGLIIQAPTEKSDMEEYHALFREIGNVVLVSSLPLEGKKSYDCLYRNILHGIDECLSALYAAGRRKIALLYTVKGRFESIKKYYPDRDYLNCLDNLRVYGNHIEDGYHVFPDSLLPHLESGKQYDAICCSCDEGAAQVINLLKERGIRVPEDIAVCGINNNPITECFRPQIASIERNNNMVANSAVEMLLKRIETPEMPPCVKEIKMEFIPRESAGLRKIQLNIIAEREDHV